MGIPGSVQICGSQGFFLKVMYTYRNKKTGIEVVVPCAVEGDWELVEENKSESTAEEKPKKKAPAKKKSE